MCRFCEPTIHYWVYWKESISLKIGYSVTIIIWQLVSFVYNIYYKSKSMKKKARKWIAVMIITVVVTFGVYVWFMQQPETRYLIFFGVLGMATIICFIAGFIAHSHYPTKEK